MTSPLPIDSPVPFTVLQQDALTDVLFPTFIGWRVHSASIARYTLSICLVKDRKES